ncbi:hypothetical protein Dhaf_1452 [Desulfitobacterium hafniense DCB-2]|uniref:DUF5659 domain-containing protein n=1 Tax=Desulfitobacterium hafniense (strain DSM 10664 / DCB-2) TaxID=272564 RepID=B8FNY0_DESHD|nr:DUF5659 domain-containing protein [Desulfitobacterium hafniense]ACL19505.1 hypothetical protein Dhaf_1452 [Desulfitobacterium hafniense DCB-2]
MDNQKFKTSDFNLAAYLMTNGAECYGPIDENGKCFFVFAKDEKTSEAFMNFKQDDWLRNYNANKKYCLNKMYEMRSEARNRNKESVVTAVE